MGQDTPARKPVRKDIVTARPGGTQYNIEAARAQVDIITSAFFFQSTRRQHGKNVYKITQYARPKHLTHTGVSYRNVDQLSLFFVCRCTDSIIQASRYIHVTLTHCIVAEYHA